MTELFSDQAVTIDGPDVAVESLAYDSRRVEPGALFAALVGGSHDGHTHVSAAIERGAVAALVERGPVVGATRIEAHDTRHALAVAARRFYGDPSSRMTCVGVTGTNGKTTTVHLVEGLFDGADRRVGLLGTLGSRYRASDDTVRQIETGLTTPQSVDLARMLAQMVDDGVDALAMEVSSHALDQERVGAVTFDVVAFTNLTHDHLDYHGTMDAYFAAKARLVHERVKPDGSVVLNMDDPRVRELRDERTIGFSAAGLQSERVWVRESSLGPEGIHLELSIDGCVVAVDSPLIGRFNVENIACAAAIGLALSLEPGEIAASLSRVRTVPGRLERVSGPTEPLVLVDYAHTPDALEKALLAAREVTEGRLICVFGCGGDRDREKRAPMGRVAGTRADQAVVTNDNPRGEAPRAIADAIVEGLRAVAGAPWEVELDRRRAIEMALTGARRGDTVLIAGKGHETYQVIGEQTLSFDDRVVARVALDLGSASKEGDR